MKVICKAISLTDKQRRVLQLPEWENPTYEFTIGKEYVVLGLTARSERYNGAVIQVNDDAGRCVFVPFCIFNVTDERSSSLWKAKQLNEFSLALWPEEFYQEYFHDDLSNGVPEVMEIYKQVVKRLENEFD